MLLTPIGPPIPGIAAAGGCPMPIRGGGGGGAIEAMDIGEGAIPPPPDAELAELRPALGAGIAKKDVALGSPEASTSSSSWFNGTISSMPVSSGRR
jgi:hypothetical protein